MISYFARHPTAANLLMLIIAFSGLLSVKDIIRETFPDFSLKEVEVQVIYPGASPVEIEHAICSRLEDRIEGVPGTDDIISESREGMGRVIVKILAGYDFQRFINDIRTEVESISDFPKLVEQITVREFNRYDPVVSIAVCGEMSYSKLKLYAEHLKDRLMEIPAVHLVRLEGVSDRRMKISVDRERLARIGLGIGDVALRVKAMNIEIPLGLVRTQDKEYILRYSGLGRTPEELKKIVIQTGTEGSEVLLGDIADIEETFEFVENRIEFNGKPAVFLKIEKNPSDDTLDIFAEVKKFIEAEKQVLTPGMSLELTQDISSIVSDRLNLIINNGITGIILIFIVLYLFFGFKLAFWVSLGLPTSFLGGLYMMKLLGITINMLSMVGLLLATGLLMDDATVISENIASVLKKKKDDVVQSGITATLEVFPGVLSSYLTTVGVFGGMMFLDGDLGRLLKAIPQILLLVMTVSLIEAFLILPHHIIHSFSGKEFTESWFRRWFDRGFAVIQDRMVPGLVRLAIRIRYIIAGTIFALLIISVGMLAGGRLKFSAMPEIEGDVIQARIILAQGTPLKTTRKVVGHIVEQLRKVNGELKNDQPGKVDLVRNIAVIYNFNQDIGDTGTHVATISADLLSAEKRNSRIDNILDLWRSYVGTVPEIQVISYKEPVIGPAGLPVHIRIRGDSFNELQQASSRVKKALSEFSGITDIIDDMRPGKPELQIRLLPGAQKYGLTASYVSAQLRTAFQGEVTDVIQQGEESFEVAVHYSLFSQKDLGVLDRFDIIAPSGQKISLSSVASVKPVRGWSRINRVNGKRTVTVYAEADTRKTNVMEVLMELRGTLFKEIMKQYPGISFELEGQMRKVSDAFPSLRRALIVGLLIVFIILSYQFGSWLEPVFIMVAIPLSIIGVIWGHILMRMDLCLPSMVGFISLTGVVVNNSILLVHFIRYNLNDFPEVIEASVEASRKRFRPIFITTLTTVVGMLPMLLEKSLQAQILIPLIISLVFGLAVSTVTVIFMIPCVYKIVEDFGFDIRRGLKKTGMSV